MHSIFHKKGKPILNATSGIASEPTNIFIKTAEAPPQPTASNYKKTFENFKQKIAEELEDVSDDDLDIPSPPKSVKKPSAPSPSIDLGSPSTPSPKPKPKPIPVPAKPVAEVRRITSESHFWDFIASLNWMDKDVLHHHNSGIAVRQLGPLDLQAFQGYFNTAMNRLRKSLEEKKFFQTFGITDKKQQDVIMSHIVARGQAFYIPVADDPCFADYLMDPPIYDNFMPHLTC